MFQTHKLTPYTYITEVSLVPQILVVSFEWLSYSTDSDWFREGHDVSLSEPTHPYSRVGWFMGLGLNYYSWCWWISPHACSNWGVKKLPTTDGLLPLNVSPWQRVMNLCWKVEPLPMKMTPPFGQAIHAVFLSLHNLWYAYRENKMFTICGYLLICCYLHFCCPK